MIQDSLYVVQSFSANVENDVNSPEVHAVLPQNIASVVGMFDKVIHIADAMIPESCVKKLCRRTKYFIIDEGVKRDYQEFFSNFFQDILDQKFQKQPVTLLVCKSPDGVEYQLNNERSFDFQYAAY